MHFAFSWFMLQILVDGVPLGELDIKWFRERIGFVGQVQEKRNLVYEFVILLTFMLQEN